MNKDGKYVSLLSALFVSLQAWFTVSSILNTCVPRDKIIKRMSFTFYFKHLRKAAD